MEKEILDNFEEKSKEVNHQKRAFLWTGVGIAAIALVSFCSRNVEEKLTYLHDFNEIIAISIVVFVILVVFTSFLAIGLGFYNSIRNLGNYKTSTIVKMMLFLVNLLLVLFLIRVFYIGFESFSKNYN